MAKRANPRQVGVFVLGAIALAIAAIAVLGSGRLFRQTDEFVCFFDNSVNGLRVGAAVKFKGVEIGSVKNILLSLNIGPATTQSDASSIKIPVIIELDRGRLIHHGVANVDLSDPAALKQAVDRGLRAQLATESLVTGLLYIDLDMHPGAPAHFVLPANSEYQEIPTLPTAFEQAQSAASRLIGQLDKIELDRLVNTATESLAAVRDLAASPDLKAAMVALRQSGESLARTSDSLRALSEHLDHQIGPLTQSLALTSKNAADTFKQAQVTLDHFNNTLQPDAPLLYRTNQTLTEVSEAARALRQLADYLERNPSSVVRGRSYEKTTQ